MKSLLVTLLILAVVSCKSDKSNTIDNIAMLELAKPQPFMFEPSTGFKTAHPHPYELKLNMTQLEDKIYDLEVSMLLNNDSKFISPNAKRGFKGKFSITMDESEDIELFPELIETPLSVEEYDSHPFVDGFVNWVREDTKYNQKLKRTAQENFHVKGMIQFVIEPRCTFEKIPIIIKYEEGEMRVELFGC